MFLDHHDYYLDNVCELLYNTITEYNVDVVSGNFYNDNIQKESLGLKINEKEGELHLYQDIDEKSKIMHFPPSICAKIYNKKFLDKNNIRFCNYKIGEDKLFLYHVLFSKSKILKVNEPMLVYELKETLDYKKRSKNMQYTLSNLLTFTEVLKKIYELYKIYANEYKHILLNDVNYLTNEILKNTSLTYDEFKIFADTSFDYYTEYKISKDTTELINIGRFINYLVAADDMKAYNEYKKLSYDSIPINHQKMLCQLL